MTSSEARKSVSVVLQVETLKGQAMKFDKLLWGGAIAGALVLSTGAMAADEVHFSPTATNGGSGAIGSAADFSAVGFQSNLTSSLVILGSSGSGVSYSESGVINITSFRNASDAEVASGVNSDYTLQGAFTISGTGNWAGNSFTANAIGTTFNVNLWANGIGTGDLVGTASLSATDPQVALAIAFGSLTPGSSGIALTSLTATLNFTPEPGYGGPGGFFAGPNPMGLFDISVGNAGGNTSNTCYSVAGTTVTFVVPCPGTNQGTANATFRVNEVPEPGALALAGVALLGMIGATRRRRQDR